jgi:predicted HicB family RNase H-like nuclease
MASGQLRVRLPVDLHEALTAEAERQGVSLNTLIVALLAGGLRFKLPRS